MNNRIAICNFGRGVMTSSDSLETTTVGSRAERSKGVSSLILESVMASRERERGRGDYWEVGVRAETSRGFYSEIWVGFHSVSFHLTCLKS